MAGSPWIVESLEDFLYYCCPECNERSQSREEFLQHALNEHPEAKNHLIPISVKNEYYNDASYYMDDYDDDDSHDTKDIEREYGTVQKQDHKYLKQENLSQHCEVVIKEEKNSDHEGDENYLEGGNENVWKSCKHCGKTFPKQSYLRRHMSNAHEEIAFECKHCDMKFSRSRKLKEHVRNVHPSGPSGPKLKYKCDFKACENTFLTFAEMRDHKANDHVGDPMNYYCEHCAKGYNDKKNYKRHLISVHGDKRFPCTICGKDFGLETTLKAHIKTIHDCIKNYSCEEAGCGKAYATPSLLKIHVDRVHKGIRIFCELCGKAYWDQYALNNHINKMHTGKKRFQCDFDGCDASFDKFGDMKKHKKIDHAGDICKYQCHECGKGYNLEAVLQDHIDRIHKGIREICQTCGKQFTRKHSLKLHMKVHENESEPKHYGNTIEFHPDSDFEDLSNDPKFPSPSWNYFLYNHKQANMKVLDTKTGQEKVAPDNAAHKCRFCGELVKKSRFIPHLIKHNIGIEASEKGFGHKKDPERLRCPHCGKMHKKLPELRDHINTHTGERPHVCKYCGKTFASSGNMNAHIRQAHLGKKRNSNERKSHMIKPEILIP